MFIDKVEKAWWGITGLPARYQIPDFKAVAWDVRNVVETTLDMNGYDNDQFVWPQVIRREVSGAFWTHDPFIAGGKTNFLDGTFSTGLADLTKMRQSPSPQHPFPQLFVWWRNWNNELRQVLFNNVVFCARSRGSALLDTLRSEKAQKNPTLQYVSFILYVNFDDNYPGSWIVHSGFDPQLPMPPEPPPA
jgi:hypothetical protein